MRAALRYFALVYYENAVSVTCIHKAVRDQDDSLLPSHLADAVKDDLLALHIDVAGRLVENIDRAVMQKSPCKGKPLSLTAGKVLAVLGQLCVQAVRSFKELIHSALCQDFPEPVVVCLWISHQKIVPDSPLEQIRTAADICDPPHTALFRALRKVIWADHDRAALHGIAPDEKRRDGGFAAAALPHNARKTVLRDLHVDLVQDFPLSVVGETDALKQEIAAVYRELDGLRFRLFQFQEFEDPVAGRHSVHCHVEVAAEPSHGKEEIR